jgi:hypothetical protein
LRAKPADPSPQLPRRWPARPGRQESDLLPPAFLPRDVALFLFLFAAGADLARAETSTDFLILRQDCDGMTCTLAFPTTPANRRVDLSQVSCNNATTGPQLQSTVLRLSPVSGLAIRLVPHPTEQGLNSGFLYDQTIPLSVRTGQKIEISVTAASNTSIVLICALMGNLAFLP